MNFLSIILGILGLVATLVGSGLAYIAFVNPMVRFKWYLKKKDNWRTIFPRVEGLSEYSQYSKHPEFTIEEIYDRRWERDEPWMKKVIRPDKSCHASQIALKVSGNIIHTENFLSMDGSRIFVPIPKVDTKGKDKEAEFIYYYDEIQILLAGLLGKYHIYDTLEKFCKDRIRLDYNPENR